MALGIKAKILNITAELQHILTGTKITTPDGDAYALHTVRLGENLKARYTHESPEYNNTTGVLTVPEGINQVYIVNNGTALVMEINEEFNIPVAATGDDRGHDEYCNRFDNVTSITITPGSSFIIELSG